MPSFQKVKSVPISDIAEEHEFALEIWGEANSRRSLQAVCARVTAILDRNDIAMAGARLINLTLVSTEISRPSRSRRHLCRMNFRALTEEG